VVIVFEELAINTVLRALAIASALLFLLGGRGLADYFCLIIHCAYFFKIRHILGITVILLQGCEISILCHNIYNNMRMITINSGEDRSALRCMQ